MKSGVKAVWGIAVIVMAVYLYRAPNNFLINIPLILGWVLFLFQITWDKSERFYIWWKRLVFIIKNPESIWNMRITFKGYYERNIFNKIDNIFSSQSKKLSITSLSNTRKLYRLSSISFEVVLREDLSEIDFMIHDLEVSYRRSKQIIERELAHIFEIIQMDLKPDSGNYHLNIEFKGLNPYFGFFVRRLNISDVNGFNVTFKVESDQITVSKRGIEINTRTIQNLNTLSKDYLALSPR